MTWSPGTVIYGATSGYVTDQGTHWPFPAADIFAPEGTTIFAPETGILTARLFQRGGYAAFLLAVDDQHQYYFAHGQIPFLQGAVAKGQAIGYVGSTGTGPAGYADNGGTSPHLHLAISSDGDFSRGKFGGSGDIWVPTSLWTTLPREDEDMARIDELETALAHAQETVATLETIRGHLTGDAIIGPLWRVVAMPRLLLRARDRLAEVIGEIERHRA